MADDPRVQQAKEKLRDMVVPAVDTLEGLMKSEHDGIRLGAVKEVFDRGGVPAKQEHTHAIEVTLDDEIEQLIAGVKRQVEQRNNPDKYDDVTIEDAEVVEDENSELPAGEKAGQYIGVPVDDREPEPEEVEVVEAWWQATP